MSGANLEGYQVLSEIGRGGMGVVYRARSSDGRDVAVKLVLSREPGALARFDRERRLQAELGLDAGFVPLLDARETPRGPMLVMPFLAGGTLRARLARGPLAVAETVALGRALATTLGRAHARAVVHRDLKPENVLFDEQGRPFVGDLGVAKSFRPAPGSVSLTKTTDVVGTVTYMAPEQADRAKDAGPAADVFALGAILYECLAGRPAFEGGDTLEVLLRRARGVSVAPLASVRADVPRWLSDAVARALETDPARRFPDGAALARALEEPRPAAAAPGSGRALALVTLVIGLVAGGGVGGVLAARAHQHVASLESELARARAPKAPAEPGGDPASPDALATALARNDLDQVAALLAKRDASFDARRALAWKLEASPDPASRYLEVAQRLSRAKAPRVAALVALAAFDHDPIAVSKSARDVVPLLRAGAEDALASPRTLDAASVALARRSLLATRFLDPGAKLEDLLEKLWRAGESREPAVRVAARPWWWAGADAYRLDIELRGPAYAPEQGAAATPGRFLDIVTYRWVAQGGSLPPLAWLKSAIEVDCVLYHPEVAAFWCRAAGVLTAGGDHRVSELVARGAVARFPECSEAHHALGEALLQQHRFEEAARALETALEKDDRNPWLWHALAVAQAQSDGDGPRRAFETLRKTVELDKGMANAPLFLGTRSFVLERLGQTDEARATTEELFGRIGRK